MGVRLSGSLASAARAQWGRGRSGGDRELNGGAPTPYFYDLGLEDTTLELTKIAVLGSVSSAPLGRDTELRSQGEGGDKLQFAWIAVAGEAPLEWLAVERGAYDEIATDADGDWAELRADLGVGAAYVDMNRLIIAAAPA